MDNKLTVIIPVHKIGDTEKEYFKKAITSVSEQIELPKKVMLVIPKTGDVKKTLKSFDYDNKIKDRLVFVENDGDTDFCSQINLGVSKLDTNWFSILELDDEYSKIWIKNFNKYLKHYEDVDMFLPIVLDTNVEGRFLHFTNEPVWAKDFSENHGLLDNDSLLNYPQFQISGGVYKKDSYEVIGGLKPSIKMQFVYEFFLRATYYDKKIMTIPKVGYRKTNMREDSLFYNYSKGDDKIDPLEARFWFNTAKKECYFKQDREITYNREEQTV